MATREQRDERKAEGLCTQCGKQAAADDSNLCAPHQRVRLALRRVADRKRRARRRKQGRCAFCPNKATKYRCVVCATKRRALRMAAPDLGALRGADAARARRVAARTAVDGDGRVRGHGRGKRGAIDRLSLVEDDGHEAAATVLRGVETFKTASADPSVPALQRKAAQQVAYGLFDLAARFLEAIMRKGGYQRQALVDAYHDGDVRCLVEQCVKQARVKP